MKTWITLSETDIREYLNAAQRENLQARPDRDAGSDPLSAIIAEAVAAIRSDIRSVETNFLAEDEATIPPELKRTAVLLAVALMPGRISGILLTENQLIETEEAQTVLSRIRSGSLPVSLPDEPEAPEVRTSFGLEVARKRNIRLSGENLSGL